MLPPLGECENDWHKQASIAPLLRQASAVFVLNVPMRLLQAVDDYYDLAHRLICAEEDRPTVDRERAHAIAALIGLLADAMHVGATAKTPHRLCEQHIRRTSYSVGSTTQREHTYCFLLQSLPGRKGIRLLKLVFDQCYSESLSWDAQIEHARALHLKAERPGAPGQRAAFKALTAAKSCADTAYLTVHSLHALMKTFQRAEAPSAHAYVPDRDWNGQLTLGRKGGDALATRLASIGRKPHPLSPELLLNARTNPSALMAGLNGNVEQHDDALDVGPGWLLLPGTHPLKARLPDSLRCELDNIALGFGRRASGDAPENGGRRASDDAAAEDGTAAAELGCFKELVTSSSYARKWAKVAFAPDKQPRNNRRARELASELFSIASAADPARRCDSASSPKRRRRRP